MLTCFVCSKLFPDLKKLYGHFKSAHGICFRNSRYTCCQGQCSRTFSNKYAFGKHVLRFHSNDIHSTGSNIVNVNASEPTISDVSPTAVPECSPGDHYSVISAQDNSPDSINVSELACKFICHAKSRISTLENAQEMVNACSELVSSVVGALHNEFQLLRQAPCESGWNALDKNFVAATDPFKGLKTEPTQRKQLEHMGVFVPPTQYGIGKSQIFVTDKRTGFVKPVLRQVTGQFVSIRKMLFALNEHTAIISTAVTQHVTSGDGNLTNFFDGLYWKNHPLHGQNVIILRFYGDDFEPANALGPHRTIYKIGCIYYQLENLPKNMQSKTQNIFMALCYHSDDVKAYGWQAVLKPLILEMQELECDGIQLNINGHTDNYKVVVGCVTGDNLFLNSFAGFVESFTANRPCRHCVVPRCDFGSVLYEQADSVRTPQSFDDAVAECNTAQTGVKAQCALNILTHFHCVRNTVQDVMHDILEGVCSYDMLLLCKQFIKEGLFTLEFLNSQFQSLSYSYHDLCNKPPILTSVDNDMLPFDASEIWCFVLHFAIAVGHCITHSSKLWHFYLHLRQIMDIVMSPHVLLCELDLLKVLVAEYLEMRNELFPQVTIKNKHHHLTHYPRLIQLFGPLIHLWSMRFEQKHQRCKRLMHISGNFKNVPMSIATRHQHDVAARLLLMSSVAKVQLGSGSVVTLAEVANGSLIDEALGGNCLYLDFYCCKSVHVDGVLYKCGCCLVSGFDEDTELPSFVLLDRIFARDQGETVIFFCEKLVTQSFDQHFHAWEVGKLKPKHFVCIKPDALKYYLPSNLHVVDNNMFILNLRYRI